MTRIIFALLLLISLSVAAAEKEPDPFLGFFFTAESIIGVTLSDASIKKGECDKSCIEFVYTDLPKKLNGIRPRLGSHTEKANKAVAKIMTAINLAYSVTQSRGVRGSMQIVRLRTEAAVLINELRLEFGFVDSILLKPLATSL